MNPLAPIPAALAGRPSGSPMGRTRTRDTSAAAHRFGAAAHLLDRLDTRPIEQRQPARPWWRWW
ncbi:hypothetical protein [Xenophilus sp. Marseille-Q4582]|uniref:hypothetical protein n=1 Tax=Xenophilus sp. Marseille-Q4582 TaxID=2866600 RepID=UPI001CE3CAAD|nr:hypothetical protein [Xenophilus sp. Marseille-Q4582]